MNGVSISTLLYFGVKALSSAIPVILFVFLLLVLYQVLRLFGFFQKGNQKQFDPIETSDSDSVLKGKHLIFLGSSVTKGTGSRNISFVDMIRSSTGALTVKEAVAGTTLANKGNGKSYVERLLKLDPNQPCDAFVCQLSTNDATFKVDVGTVADDNKFNDKTVCGALETIFSYVKQHWDCPIVVYTNPRYGSVHYNEMCKLLLELKKKWGIEIIDFWNDDSLTEVFSKKKEHYMNDSIHPTKKGYQYLTPYFVKTLTELISGIVPSGNERQQVSSEMISKLERKGKRKLVLRWIGIVLLSVFLGVNISSGIQLNNGLGIIKAGNADKYNPENYPVLESSPIKGKNILCVGSSVTQGYAAKNTSFVEYISHIDQANMIKEVWPATTVTTKDENSYYPRLKHYGPQDRIDAVVIQLSSNDSTFGSSLGEISSSTDLKDLDDSTFTGAMEAMIAYAQETWNCPVIVYSDPYFRVKAFYDTAKYDEMVQATKAACQKWNAIFMNLWEDEEVNSIPLKDYKFYMSDVVHPTKAGYAEWWTPMFQKVLYEAVK